MTLRFVPPPTVARYAVYTVTHGLKVYDDLGSAKNAARRRSGINRRNASRNTYILENVNGEWFILYQINIGDTKPPWHTRESAWGHSFAVPMTREEYAEWRIKVHEEQSLGILGKDANTYTALRKG